MCSLKKEILEMLSEKCAEVGGGYWAAGHKRSLRGAGLSGLISRFWIFALLWAVVSHQHSGREAVD